MHLDTPEAIRQSVEIGFKGAGVDYVKAWLAQKLVGVYGASYDHDILRNYGSSIALISDADGTSVGVPGSTQ